MCNGKDGLHEPRKGKMGFGKGMRKDKFFYRCRRLAWGKGTTNSNEIAKLDQVD